MKINIEIVTKLKYRKRRNYFRIHMEQTFLGNLMPVNLAIQIW